MQSIWLCEWLKYCFYCHTVLQLCESIIISRSIYTCQFWVEHTPSVWHVFFSRSKQ
uniref:Uncharacterized protein n=1 Tax=Arundo donax TaxID=35708 RepID=A0A0A9FPL8_ARUDO